MGDVGEPLPSLSRSSSRALLSEQISRGKELAWFRSRHRERYNDAREAHSRWRQLLSWFHALQAGERGVIDVADLQGLLALLGISEDAQQRVLDGLDEDGSGDLSLSEFMETLRRRRARKGKDEEDIAKLRDDALSLLQRQLESGRYGSAELPLESRIATYRRRVLMRALMSYGDDKPDEDKCGVPAATAREALQSIVRLKEASGGESSVGWADRKGRRQSHVQAQLRLASESIAAAESGTGDDSWLPQASAADRLVRRLRRKSDRVRSIGRRLEDDRSRFSAAAAPPRRLLPRQRRSSKSERRAWSPAAAKAGRRQPRPQSAVVSIATYAPGEGVPHLTEVAVRPAKRGRGRQRRPATAVDRRRRDRVSGGRHRPQSAAKLSVSRIDRGSRRPLSAASSVGRLSASSSTASLPARVRAADRRLSGVRTKRKKSRQRGSGGGHWGYL
eukprot:PLAT441.1.p1 GENE.PLAT441.1~~PLAT441.1.p1  ORF type:complete len:447 (+),score=139.59 PLAT441.1:23-1363(+)